MGKVVSIDEIAEIATARKRAADLRSALEKIAGIIENGEEEYADWYLIDQVAREALADDAIEMLCIGSTHQWLATAVAELQNAAVMIDQQISLGALRMDGRR